MKISLPNILRTALIAGFAQFVPIITIASASLVAISAQAQAVDYEITDSKTESVRDQSEVLYSAVVGDKITMDFNSDFLLKTQDLSDEVLAVGIVANIDVVNWAPTNGYGGSLYVFHGDITGAGLIDQSSKTQSDTYHFTGDLSGFTGGFRAAGNFTLNLSGNAIDTLSADITFNGSSVVKFTGGGVHAVKAGSTMTTAYLYIEGNTAITFDNTVDLTEGGSHLKIDEGSTATFTQDLLSVGFLDTGAGTLNVKNLEIKRASNSDVQIKATGTVSLLDTYTGNTVGSITASSLTSASNLTATTSLTLTGANTTSSITGNATTGALTLSNGSALNVTGILTTTSITVNGSTGASITTPLISAGSIAAESLIISLTESALASMDFGDDGKFTLINLGTEFAGDIIFSVEGYKEATLANGGKDLIIWGGYTQYIITSDTTSGQQIFIQEGEKIPEPSTASLSLLALAGLLARRRRKQA